MSGNRGRNGQAMRRRAEQHAVTRDGVGGVRPDHEAVTGAADGGRWRARRVGRGGGVGASRVRRGEQPMVPRAEFTSYYGKPIINSPVWESTDIAGYLFLGGLAGASALLGAGAQVTGRPTLATVAKTGAFGAGAVSVVALIHDLGRPARFLNMMRVAKVTSPMSIGSWLLGGFVPAAGVAAGCALTGRLPRIGAAATAGAALLGPAVASYTAALISNTAVPAWHDAYREMPFKFTGSAAMAAGGLGLLAAPLRENAPARNLAVAGMVMEAAAFERMRRRMGMVAEPYETGRGGVYMKAGQVLSVLGLAGAVLGRRSRTVSAVSGAAFLASSAATRFGIFHAGMASAEDPKYTVVPQRERIRARERDQARRAAAEAAG